MTSQPDHHSPYRRATPNPEHHFVFDPPKLSFYAATCYTWLGELDRAEC